MYTYTHTHTLICITHMHTYTYTQVHAYYTKAAESSFVDFAGWVQRTIEANRIFKLSQPQ